MSGVRWRRLIRGAGMAAAAAAGVAAILFFWGERYADRDFLPWFQDRKAELASVSETVLESTPSGTVLQVRLTDDRGLEIEGHLRVPPGGGQPHPALLILGGVRTGKRTVDYLGDTGDWMVLALDYPYHGPRSGLSRREFLAALPAMRRAMLDTVPAGMLAVDYLWRRGDVARDRVLLAGGSFGALFAPALGAAEPRISAVAIFFGAGDLEALIDANLDLAWPLKPLVTWCGSVLVSPMEPLKYIGRISPRPVFLLNGTDDPAMPERCSRALQEAAQEPKAVRWLPVGHVNVRSPEFHRQVVDEFVSWLVDLGWLEAGERNGFRPPG